MTRKILLLFLSGLSWYVGAQQTNTYSQYTMNKYEINPAAAGCESYMPVFLSYKQFWSGIDGAPRIEDISINGKLSSRVGFGAKIFDDSYGAFDKFGGEFTYAYHLPLGNGKTKLALGLSAMLYQQYLDPNKINVMDRDDNLIIFSSDKEVVVDFNAGAYLYSDKFFFGAALYQLTNRKITMMNDELNLQQQMQLNVVGGYHFSFSDKWGLEPSVLAKATINGNYQADCTLKLSYNSFWIGCDYRTSEAICLFFGFKKGNIMAGYCYDMVISGLSNYTNGSNELIIGYRFNNAKPKLLN